MNDLHVQIERLYAAIGAGAMDERIARILDGRCLAVGRPCGLAVCS